MIPIQFPPCEACPRKRAQIPGPCPAQTSGHRRYCDLAAVGDIRHDATLCRVAGSTAPPPLVTQIIAFAGAMIGHVAAGMPTLDDEQVEARLAICRECLDFDAEKILCDVCGCGLLRKAPMGDQHCPVGKW